MGGTLWYYAKNNQQQGPVSEDELLQLFSSAQIPEETLVWSQGMANWTAAFNITLFAEAAAAARRLPPPLPEPEPLPAAAQAQKQSDDGVHPWLKQGEQKPSHQPNTTRPQYEAATGTHQLWTQDASAALTASPDSSTAVDAQVAAGGEMKFETSFSWEESTPPQDNATADSAAQSAVSGGDSGGGKWGNLDAIPTPGAAQSAVSGGDSEGRKWGNLDAIPTPGAAQPAVAGGDSEGGKWGNLDAIPTPGASALGTTGGDSQGSKWGNLDAIPTPGASALGTTGGDSQGSKRATPDAAATPGNGTKETSNGFDRSQLDAIPTPKAQGAFNPSDLDSIPTPRSQTTPQGLRIDGGSSVPSLLRSGDTGTHQRQSISRSSLNDLRQTSSLRNQAFSAPPEPEQTPVSKIRAFVMRLLGKQE